MCSGGDCPLTITMLLHYHENSSTGARDSKKVVCFCCCRSGELLPFPFSPRRRVMRGDDGGFVGDVKAGPAFPIVDYFTPSNVLTLDS